LINKGYIKKESILFRIELKSQQVLFSMFFNSLPTVNWPQNKADRQQAMLLIYFHKNHKKIGL